MLRTYFDKQKLIITCKGSGGDSNYNYEFFKKDFEEWANELDIFIADIHHLKQYLNECGYKIIDIKEVI